MITTVTLNAAIDKTYEMASFHIHQVNRTKTAFSEPGGKGINVAKVLHALNVPVTASGIVGGFNGKQICMLLDEIGLQHDFVHIQDESRLCLNIIEPAGEQTEILESGPGVSRTDWEALKEKFLQLITNSETVVLSGSLPMGLPKGAYGELIKMARLKTRVILDTSGPALEEALAAKPFMIKPNEQEFEDILGRSVSDEAEMAKILNEWKTYGIPVVVVTLGDRGAMVLANGEIYKVTAPTISAVNPVGSGDAFTAGMASGFEKGWPIEETLKLAAATGAANALEAKAGVIDLKKLERLKNEVQIEKR